MEADDIVLEYLRGKLKKSQGARADAILKPPVEAAEEVTEMAPEDLSELEALVGAESSACPECGAEGGCEHAEG